MSDWRSLAGDAPDWIDAGRVELRSNDNAPVSGVISAKGSFVESDYEIPVFELTLDDGSVCDLYAFTHWRAKK